MPKVATYSTMHEISHPDEVNAGSVKITRSIRSTNAGLLEEEGLQDTTLGLLRIVEQMCKEECSEARGK
jgi:hypothetical protein